MVRKTCLVATLFLLLTYQPAAPAPPAPIFTPRTVGPLTVLVGPLDYSTSIKDGLVGSGEVRALGGTGDLRAGYGLGGQVLAVTLRDADALQVVRELFPDLPAAVRDLVKGGKVGLMTLSVRGDALTFTAEKFRIPKDPIRRVEATADLKAGTYKARVYALGGLIELDGKIHQGGE